MQNAPDQATRRERHPVNGATCYPAKKSHVAALLLSSPPASSAPLPYTPAMHSARCAEAARLRSVLVQYVQIRTRCGTECGKLAGLWTTPDGLDLWVIDTLGGGRSHLPARNVTQCSGLDGRCLCAGEGVTQ